MIFLKQLLSIIDLCGLIPCTMSRICEVCGKSYLRGNKVPRGVGRRVVRRTTIRQMPNLRVKRFNLNGTNVKVVLCSSCLKRMKFEAVNTEKSANTPKA